MAEQELSRHRARLGGLTPAQEEAVRQMAASLVNKLLHPPTLALKRYAAQNGGGMRVRLIREIFGMDPPSDGSSDTSRTEDTAPESAELPARRDHR